ncbi:OB-fold domain-containing protein [Amycolatopsis sp. MEPSY49]|uniref:OB-fold domain-containing protein n=1 Tax=Amycolatopsis sp. MEPSY49 TaxID=3151600 RepID=UPI003EF3B992
MTPRTTAVALRAGASYVPRYRLTGEEIERTHNRTGGRGARSLAGPDEDALTLAVEAARRLPAGALDGVRTVLFCSTSAPYLVKNNASAAAAALGLAPDVLAVDAGGSLRSAVGALLGAAPGTLILAGEVSTSRPGAPQELTHGDAGVALVVGETGDARATVTAAANVTDEIQDHWRDPARPWVSQSEDRFPVERYLTLLDAAADGFADADHVVISAASSRVAKAAGKKLGRRGKVGAFATAGYTGSADLLVQLCGALAECAAGQTVLAATLSDGADVLRIEAGDGTGEAFVHGATGATAVPTYLQALTWRGLLEREPPRRPEPRVVSAPAALRGAGWKYSLLASVCAACGFVSTPPQQVCLHCGSTEHGEPVDMTRRPAAIRTFSVDRLAYSLNPPMVAAVVGFEGGGRLEVELTDTDLAALRVGAPVRMTFRRRHSSGGVHNYVWKATVPGGTGGGGTA